MKTYTTVRVKETIESSGFSFEKRGDYWVLLDGADVLLENLRLGDLVDTASEELGM